MFSVSRVVMDVVKLTGNGNAVLQKNLRARIALLPKYPSKSRYYSTVLNESTISVQQRDGNFSYGTNK